MSVGPNTTFNIGIRRNFVTLGYRNWETAPSQPYLSNRVGLWFQGSSYAIGASLPFDVGGTSYSLKAQQELLLYWNQGWITPQV